MNNSREKFEQKFPFPIGVKFHSDGDYIWLGGNHHGDTCEPYDSMWKAWQAATEQSQKEIAEKDAMIAEYDRLMSIDDTRIVLLQHNIVELKAREKVLVEALESIIESGLLNGPYKLHTKIDKIAREAIANVRCEVK